MQTVVYILCSFATVILSPMVFVGVITLAITDIRNRVFRKTGLMPRLKVSKYLALTVALIASIIGLIYYYWSIMQILHPAVEPLLGASTGWVAILPMLIVSALLCVAIVFAILLWGQSKIVKVRRQRNMVISPDPKRMNLIIVTSIFGGLAILGTMYYFFTLFMALFVSYLNV